MPRQRGIWRELWRTCDRCGFIHPVGMLIQQKGMLLCTDHGCVDNLDVEQRPFLIGLILTAGDDANDQFVDSPPTDIEF